MEYLASAGPTISLGVPEQIGLAVLCLLALIIVVWRGFWPVFNNLLKENRAHVEKLISDNKSLVDENRELTRTAVKAAEQATAAQRESTETLRAVSETLRAHDERQAGEHSAMITTLGDLCKFISHNGNGKPAAAGKRRSREMGA